MIKDKFRLGHQFEFHAQTAPSANYEDFGIHVIILIRIIHGDHDPRQLA